MLALAYPLILSHITFTIQVFMDRLFLTWYSVEAVAGAVTGLFVDLGRGRPVPRHRRVPDAFIAQYLGAGRPGRVGPAVWQGIYFAARPGSSSPACSR